MQKTQFSPGDFLLHKKQKKPKPFVSLSFIIIRITYLPNFSEILV